MVVQALDERELSGARPTRRRSNSSSSSSSSSSSVRRKTGGTAKQASEGLQASAWPWSANCCAVDETRPSGHSATSAGLLGRATQSQRADWLQKLLKSSLAGCAENGFAPFLGAVVRASRAVRERELCRSRPPGDGRLPRHRLARFSAQAARARAGTGVWERSGPVYRSIACPVGDRPSW